MKRTVNKIDFRRNFQSAKIKVTNILVLVVIYKKQKIGITKKVLLVN